MKPMTKLSKTALLILSFLGRDIAMAQPSIHWQKTYGGSAFYTYSGVDGANSVQRTRDGGYIFAGYSGSGDGEVTGNHGGMDCWVVKTDDTGMIQWERSYGGSMDDIGAYIVNDVNGGYIITGTTYSNDGDLSGNHGGGDAWIIKINDTGAILWQKVMGSSGYDFANTSINTSDSGYLITGSAGANDGDVTGLHGSNDVWIIRLDKAGVLLWDKVYGTIGTDYGLTGYPTAGGGFIISAQAGYNGGDVTEFHGGYGDAWIIKLDDTGTIQWQKTYGGSGYEQAASVLPAPGGGYVFSASTYSDDGDVTGFHGGTTNPDIWVVKINDTGVIQWENCYGGNGAEYAISMIQAYDGTYVIAGLAVYNNGDVSGSHGDADFWLIDVNASGALVWQKCLGGSGYDTAFAVIQTPDSGFVVAGATASFDGQVTGNHGVEDYWIVKLYKPDTAVTTAITNAATTQPVNVFPAITNGTIHISMPEGYENAKVNIVCATGQTEAVFPGDHGLYRTISLGNIPPGMYLLRVVNNDAVQTFKIVYLP